MDDQMLRAECPHCSFRFADPEEPLQESAQLGCPECRGVFYVLSLRPPVFDVVDPRYGSGIAVHAGFNRRRHE